MSHIAALAKPYSAIIFKHTYGGTTYVVAVGFNGQEFKLIDFNTDADTVFDSCLTFIGGLGEGELFWCRETYDLDAQHTMINNLTIIGEGEEATVLNVTGNVNVFYIANGSPRNNITICSIGFVLTNAASAGATNAIYFLNGDNWKIIDVKVVDATNSAGGTSRGITVGNYGSAIGNVNNAWVINCVSDGRGVRNFTSFQVNGVINGWVINCRFKGRDADVPINGAFSPCTGVYRCQDVKFANTVIEYGHHNGVFWPDNSAAGFYSEGICFVECTIRENGDDGMDPNNDFDCIVVACRFVNNASYAISLEDDCHDWTIVGNSPCGSIGVSDSWNVNIVGNNISAGTGVYIQTASYDVTVCGNHIYATSASVRIVSSTKVTVDGNVCNDTNYSGYNIRLESSTDIIVSSNILYGWDGSSARAYAVQETGTSDYNTIVANNVRGHRTPVATRMAIIGANSICCDNIGYNPLAASTPAVGASPVTFGPYHYPVFFIIVGGTITSVSIRGQNTGLGAANSNNTFYLHPTDSITITYTGAPTVTVYPQ